MMKHYLTVLCLILAGQIALAQGTIKGYIVDKSNNEPLIGATIAVKGSSIGTATALDGSFSLKIPAGTQNIKCSFVGYIDFEQKITIKIGEVLDLSNINLSSNAVNLTEVRIVASMAVQRQTPVAVSTIQPKVILEKLGTQEFPEILKSTPSVYATKQGGGFGDSRIYLRGFDSNNIGVLINGIPVNGMENGKVYWSNWAGLSDVTQGMQVQRGLGASKLALSSVGGTINIVTKSTDAKKGGTIYSGLGNDGFRKQMLTLSTGLLENGWAVTASGSHSYGNGYIQATNFDGWSYFMNISKILNEKHRLSLTAFGAPQWHNQRSNKHYINDYRNHQQGAKFNSDFGYRDGKIYNGGYAYNYYHKPQVSLNHYWNLDETSMLSTSLYISKSKGGGRRIYGANKNWLSIDNNTGRPYEGETKLTPEGYLDFDYAIAQNMASTTGSQAIIANSINSHDWYGALSTYTKNISNLKLTGGFDGRYYRGYHTYQIEDLLGGAYFQNNSNVNRDETTTLYKGDYVNYYNLGEVLWAGLFSQAEYVTSEFSAFVSVSGANNSYRRIDYFQYTPEEGQVSDWQSFWTWTAKGGANYNIDDNHNVFVNGGYITRAPYFRNAFLGHTNEINTEAKNEKIVTSEIGYGYQSKVLKVTANIYYTQWKDKGLVKRFGDITANIPGINARHYGLEVEAKYRPNNKLDIGGMVSVGDWRWTDNVEFEAYDDEQNHVGTYYAYIKGIHVGNSAQTTAWFSVNYKILPKLKIGTDFVYYGNNYSEFDPTNRTNKEDQIDAWQLPDAYVIDANVKYSFKIGKMDATLYGKVDNILNTEYIADAKDGVNHDVSSSLVYYGFGRTWSTGLKIKF